MKYLFYCLIAIGMIVISLGLSEPEPKSDTDFITATVEIETDYEKVDFEYHEDLWIPNSIPDLKNVVYPIKDAGIYRQNLKVDKVKIN